MLKLKGLPGTRLSGLAKLPPPSLPDRPKQPQEEIIPVAPPFSSQWDVWIYRECLKLDPYWVAQYQLGQYGDPNSTRPELIHFAKKIVLYVDGPVHSFRFLQGRDLILRSQWLGLGYRVVTWIASDFDDLKTHFLEWYRRDIGN